MSFAARCWRAPGAVSLGPGRARLRRESALTVSVICRRRPRHLACRGPGRRRPGRLGLEAVRQARRSCGSATCSGACADLTAGRRPRRRLACAATADRGAATNGRAVARSAADGAAFLSAHRHAGLFAGAEAFMHARASPGAEAVPHAEAHARPAIVDHHAAAASAAIAPAMPAPERTAVDVSPMATSSAPASMAFVLIGAAIEVDEPVIQTAPAISRGELIVFICMALLLWFLVSRGERISTAAGEQGSTGIRARCCFRAPEQFAFTAFAFGEGQTKEHTDEAHPVGRHRHRLAGGPGDGADCG